MAISLFPHNQTAYDSLLVMLESEQKVCVVHPTGTGKSFIGFKYCEEHPEESVLWLSPSEYIFKTQCENLTATGATVPNNIKFLTYAKLSILTEEQLDELAVDTIIEDEFHRTGAPTWGDGLKRLMKRRPNARHIGLSATNIRYLDNQRDIGIEFYEGNIASLMTLGEAIVCGILNAPTYVLSVFAYQQDYDRLKSRVRRAKSKAVRDEADKYLEALRRALEQADGLDVIFDKHMTDRRGKYLVFCANAEHMREMIAHVAEWFGKIDPAPHVYSAYSDDPATSKAFADFKSDASDHLKLLFCIDMLNEGVHVEDVSGVILFRPTVSPIVFKQQIGRALTVGKRDAVIFDIVDNISNLYSIGALEEEMDDAVRFFRESGEGGTVIQEKFRIIDEVRDVKRMFDELERTLTASWDLLCGAARRYAEENGDLLVPSNHVTEEGYHLGEWIVTQRVLHRNGQLSAARTLRLEQLGMDWRGRNERCWEENLKAAELYVAAHGQLNPSGGSELARWLNRMRMRYRMGLLSDEETAVLERLGMVWDCAESSWTERLAQMRGYFEEHGDLNIPGTYVTADGSHLGRWYCVMKRQYRDGTLPEDKRRQLEDAGILWSSVHLSKWTKHYQEAKAYFAAHGDLDVPQGFVTDDGFKLAAWVSEQRQKRAKGKLTPEQIKLLEAIGCRWDAADARWERGYQALLAYRERFGTANVPFDYVSDDGYKLGQWLTVQRKNARKGTLDKQKQARLEKLGLEWNVFQKKWQTGYEHAAAFQKENGHLNVKHQYVSEDGYKLGVWISTQRERYRDGKLGEDERRALEALGMKWRAEYHREGRAEQRAQAGA